MELSIEAINDCIKQVEMIEVYKHCHNEARAELAALKARIAELERDCSGVYTKYVPAQDTDRNRELFETARMFAVHSNINMPTNVAYNKAESLLAERDRRRKDGAQ